MIYDEYLQVEMAVNQEGFGYKYCNLNYAGNVCIYFYEIMVEVKISTKINLKLKEFFVSIWLASEQDHSHWTALFMLLLLATN